jgi:uncharacterized membrane protein YoaK (UPF0700 family)
MSREDLGHLALGICCIGVAGYVDAVGFLKLGHLFVSFMSGNSTQFVVAAIHRDWTKALEAGGIVLLFVIGAFAGHLWALWMKEWRRPAVLILDAALLALAVLLSPARGAIVPMVLAMGMQNEALHKAGDVRTQLTYVTGTLVNFAEALAGALYLRDAKERWLWLPYLLLWIGLLIGAALGALFYGEQQLEALRWPALLLMALALITAFSAWRGRGQKNGKETI